MSKRPELQLRPFLSEDVQPANQLTNWFIEHTAVHFGVAQATDSEFREMWATGREGYPWLVATLDGLFAGYCKASVWRAREAYCRTVEVGLYVAEGARGQGVGTALYTEMLQVLRAKGFRVAIGGLTLPNEASQRLHRRLGFRQVGVFHAVGHKFGVWHDVEFWQLDLSPGAPA